MTSSAASLYTEKTFTDAIEKVIKAVFLPLWNRYEPAIIVSLVGLFLLFIFKKVMNEGIHTYGVVTDMSKRDERRLKRKAGKIIDFFHDLSDLSDLFSKK